MSRNELNKHRTDGGWINWDYFRDPIKARPGDTLTINSLDDIGPVTIEPMQMLDTIIKRGVIVDSSAICDDPHQLAGLHSKMIDERRRNRAADVRKELRESGQLRDGRPQEYSDQYIRDAHEQIRIGKCPASEVTTVFKLSKSTMSRRCAKLGLVYPVEIIDSEGSE